MIVITMITVKICAGVVGTFFLAKNVKHVADKSKYHLTTVLDSTAERPRYPTRVQRQTFTSVPLLIPREHKSHSHARAAACRNAGPHFARDFARQLGLVPFSHQQSSSDEKSDIKGTRYYFWAKDVHISPRDDKPTAENLHYAIDVDYYMDMHSALCDNFAPWCLYTLMPTSAAECTDDYSFCFNERNEVEYKVTGGGSFRHLLWDYNGDSIAVCKRFFGIPYKRAIYLVDRRQVDKHHCLVSLTPLRRWTNPLTAFLASFLYREELKRFEPVTCGQVHMEVQTKEGLVVSVAAASSCHSVTIPYKQFSALDNINRNSNKLSLGNCVALVGDLDVKGLSVTDAKRVDASVLLNYFNSKVLTQPAEVSAVETGVKTYNFDLFGPESKPTLTAFMNPIVDEAYAPAQSKANLKRAVEGRIKSIQHQGQMKVTVQHRHYMAEFVDFMSGAVKATGNGYLEPCGLEEVMERQMRPTQQKLIEDAFKNDDKPHLDSFVKKEAYAGAKDPRIITVDQPRHKVEYSQFVYPVMDALKLSIPSYMPGKNPVTVARWIGLICSDADNICISDMVRMDGTISSFARDAWKEFLLACFDMEHKANLLQLYSDSYDKTVYLTVHADNKQIMSEREKYSSKYVILSGMIDTSCFGTFTTLLALYLGLRTTKVHGAYYSPNQAWRHVCLRTAACGDDLDTVDVDAVTMRRGAAILGCKSDAYNVKKGELGVVFLSRAYGPQVWNGDPNSMTCPKRQLSKFHTTVHLQGVTPEQKLKEKARSYLLTDKETPILGPLCMAVARISGPLHRSKLTVQMERWQSDLSERVQYPNEYECWMSDLVRDELPNFDRDGFYDYINNATTLEEILNIPMFNQAEHPKVKTLVNINGDVYAPGNEEEIRSETVEKAPIVEKKKTRRGGNRAKVARARLRTADAFQYPDDRVTAVRNIPRRRNTAMSSPRQRDAPGQPLSTVQGRAAQQWRRLPSIPEHRLARV
jgi:hypothetical protein